MGLGIVVEVWLADRTAQAVPHAPVGVHAANGLNDSPRREENIVRVYLADRDLQQRQKRCWAIFRRR